MTLEEYNNIVDSYGLHRGLKYNTASAYLEKYTWGALPVLTFQEETGKLKIYIDLNDSGKMIGHCGGLRNRPHVIVSEVNTANYFLKELFKQRKKILVDNKLKEINRDFT